MAIWLLNLLIPMAMADATWTAKHETIWSTKTQSMITLQNLTQSADAQDIWVLGELHTPPDGKDDPESIIHHGNQLRFLEALRSAGVNIGFGVSVGMEFLPFTEQQTVDLYLRDQISDEDFVKTVDWGGSPLEHYKPQLLFPNNSNGRTYGLNIPRAIASKVAKEGPDSLTDKEKTYLPPTWRLGNLHYYERFKAAMGGHVPEDKLMKYFWAQSLWDSTMAHHALLAKADYAWNTLVIIVGQFHVEYGGGLPFELKFNGAKSVKTLIQAEVSDWNPAAIDELVKASPTYGEQADYIWLHSAEKVCSGSDCP